MFHPQAVRIFESNCPMKIEHSIVYCALLLSACHTTPPPSAVIAAAELPAAPRVETCNCGVVSSDVDELLSYQHNVRQMPPSEQAKALANLNRQPVSARVQMQKAMLYASMGGSGDLVRAQGQLDQLLTSIKPDAERLKPLAMLLNATYADRRRQDENAERLTQQLRDEQRRTDQLNDKLEALKDIERTLQARPRVPLGTPPEPGNPPTPN
jgi:hypothetical protein